MKLRAAILLIVVSVFVGLTLALPKASPMKPSRLAKDLPEHVGAWEGLPEEPGEKEKQILAQDTDFERMRYFKPGEFSPQIQASVVFSGKNLSQSIHRPEVCFRAQGWEFVEENFFDWEDVLPGGERLPVKELICRRVHMIVGEDGELKPFQLENGETAYIWRAFYYTFFGHEQIVSGHYERTIEDIKDRLMGGYDQRWAYATFSCFITKNLADQGLLDDRSTILDKEGTKAHVGDFLRELLPLVVADPGMGVDPSIEELMNTGS